MAARTVPSRRVVPQETQRLCEYFPTTVPSPETTVLDRGLAVEDGLIPPLLEADLSESRVGGRNQRAFAEFGPEVPRVRISDDVARVVAREKVLTDQVIETQLYGTSHFNRAIHSAILATADATSSAAMR